jgi:hypothetical protein
MLVQLLEHLSENWKKVIEDAQRTAKEGKQLPVEYWIGFSTALVKTNKALRKAIKKYNTAIAAIEAIDDIEEYDEDYQDYEEDLLWIQLGRFLNTWIDRLMDARDDAGAADYADDMGESLRCYGLACGYGQAYRDLKEIVEYLEARGDTL